MSDATVPGAHVPAGAEERTGADRASIYDVSTREDVHFLRKLAGGFAYFANLKFAQHGHQIRWFWFALAMVALIAILTYFDVRLSARLLGLALIGEVIILLIMDVGIFGQGGHNVSAAAINPIKAFQGFPGGGGLAAGAAGIGIFFAFWSWVGFEMAPNYAEESKDPKRIVPLSMYISVIGLGIFYVITSWAALSGYHSVNEAAKVAQTNSAEFFFIPTADFVGGWARDIMS